VGECREGLWLGNLFGCKLKISPCGDNNRVPLVTISMCPVASSSMVGVFQVDTPGVFSSREALAERVGADGDRGLESDLVSYLQSSSFLAHCSQAPVVSQAYATKRQHNWTLPFASSDGAGRVKRNSSH